MHREELLNGCDAKMIELLHSEPQILPSQAATRHSVQKHGVVSDTKATELCEWSGN